MSRFDHELDGKESVFAGSTERFRDRPLQTAIDLHGSIFGASYPSGNLAL